MPDTTTRRNFLSWCTSLLLSAITMLVAVPVIGYVFAPLRRRQKAQAGGQAVDLGAVAQLPLGQWVLLPLDVMRQDGWEKARQRHSVYVRRMGDAATDVTVLSPICPHLGCPLNWDSQRSQFRCPCHGGVFDAGGGRVSGPPPRAMDRLNFDIRDGRLLVAWEDFKIGEPQPVPVRL